MIGAQTETNKRRSTQSRRVTTIPVEKEGGRGRRGRRFGGTKEEAQEHQQTRYGGSMVLWGKQKTRVRNRGESKNREKKRKKEKRKSSQMEITKRNKTGQEEAGRERRERGEAGLAEGMSRGPPLGSPPSAGCR